VAVDDPADHELNEITRLLISSRSALEPLNAAMPGCRAPIPSGDERRFRAYSLENGLSRNATPCQSCARSTDHLSLAARVSSRLYHSLRLPRRKTERIDHCPGVPSDVFLPDSPHPSKVYHRSTHTRHPDIGRAPLQFKQRPFWQGCGGGERSREGRGMPFEPIRETLRRGDRRK
jgi:hypothetical protein